MYTKMSKRLSISMLILIFFIMVLHTGCVSPLGKNPAPPIPVSPEITPNTSHMEDFSILISKNGLGNVTGTITKNFSEIQTGNYADIPVLLDLEHSSYCGYNAASNYSRVADVALHDSRIQKMLRNGGIIKGIYVWGPPSYTKEQSSNPCAFLSVTLESDYRGKGVTALVNESTRTVILPPDLS